MADDPQPSQPYEILAVDDTPASLQLLTRLLAGQGYRVRPASGGLLTLESAAAKPPDLILLDICMKDLDGLEVCRRLKANAATRHLPVILLSAFPKMEDWAKFLEVGAADYIAKPFQSEELLARVKTHLTLSQTHISINRQATVLHQTNEQLQAELAHRQRAEEELRHSLDLAARSRHALLNLLEDQKRTEAEIHQLNSSLERRVRARTAELELANKELEAFSYSVSHDLRAPLRTLDGFSRILLEDYAGKLDAEAQDHLNRIRAASQRMGELIDGLLKLSRVTRGELRCRPVDLSRLAQTVAAELRQAEPARKVECLIAPDLSAPGDADLLQIVLENLLGNAWKFTAKETLAKIELGTMLQGGIPVWFVRDNGVGFDMNYSQKLFGVFQRFHSTAEFPGTGIGLATTQRIIHRHGGRIWAESQVGRGTTFYFTLPNQPADQPKTS